MLDTKMAVNIEMNARLWLSATRWMGSRVMRAISVVYARPVAV